MRNGRPAQLNWSASLTFAQYLLQDDVEHHAAAFISQVEGTCLSFSVHIHVYRTWRVAGKEFVAAPKWTEAVVNAAAREYLAASPKVAKSRAIFELKGFRVSRAKNVTAPKLLQLLHDCLVALQRQVARISRADLAEYSLIEEFDIDIEQTLEFLRAHPNILLPARDGPVKVRGKHYTPAEVMPAYEKVRRLDLAAPLELLDQSAVFLEVRSELGVARRMLVQAAMLLRSSYDPRVGPARSQTIGKWLSFSPKNVAARALKSQILAIWELCAQIASVQDAAAPASRILNESFRDFDLFEWSALMAVCRTLGFSGPFSEASRVSAIECGASVVVNANKEEGAKLVASLLPGWRDGGDFPSKYKPDVIVNYERRCSIPVDAKFRVADGISDPCGADSFKEVQAYINEFGVSGAIILVPLIPSTLVGSGDGGARRVQGSIRGREYRVWVIEYWPSKPDFERDFINALEDIASLEE